MTFLMAVLQPSMATTRPVRTVNVAEFKQQMSTACDSPQNLHQSEVRQTRYQLWIVVSRSPGII